NGSRVTEHFVIDVPDALGIVCGQARKYEYANCGERKLQRIGLQPEIDEARYNNADHAHDQESSPGREISPGRVAVHAERREGGSRNKEHPRDGLSRVEQKDG